MSDYFASEYFNIPNLEAFEKNKHRLIKLVKSGKIGIFPTDTVYGIGIAYSRFEKYNKIYEIKQRSKDKLLPIAIGQMSDLEKLINVDTIPENVKKIMKRWWPGPLTIIFNIKEDEKKNSLNFWKETSIAIRLPYNDVFCEIVKIINEPIILTSANISGEKSPKEYNEISKLITDKVDFIVDSGRCLYANESTIIDCDCNILREGALSKEEILNAIK